MCRFYILDRMNKNPAWRNIQVSVRVIIMTSGISLMINFINIILPNMH